MFVNFSTSGGTVKFSQTEPIHLKLGERVRFVLINDTMMEHPMHVHALWSELENGSGEFSPYKHTLIVKPAERVSYLVSADTPGHWAFHCHLAYHMAAGTLLSHCWLILVRIRFPWLGKNPSDPILRRRSSQFCQRACMMPFTA
jgi:hypothetical protein